MSPPLQVGLVAASSRTGRIFCHARPVAGNTSMQVTAEEIQEADATGRDETEVVPTGSREYGMYV